MIDKIGRNTRRKFLKGAAVATAATVAAPAVVKAQGPISMRWQRGSTPVDRVLISKA